MTDDSKIREQALGRVGSSLRDKWRLDQLLDFGGMASVYSATHRNGSRGAIKLLHPGLAQQEDVRQRFLREGYVANKVGHPGAVAILDDDVTDSGDVFLVMELLEGESLDARIKRAFSETKSGISPMEVLRIADQVLDVLKAAHVRGIVHRDIKPGNVFLTWDRKVKVLDFGLARVRESSGFQAKLTRDGVVMGTVNYMAPEQARGKTELIDARTDLFAVGATMFTALSGRNVHPGKTAMDRMVSAASVPARSLASVLPTAHPTLVTLVDRALAFSQDDRWPNASTMQGGVQNVRVEMHMSGYASDPPPALPSWDEPPINVEFDKSRSDLTEPSAGFSFIDEVSVGSADDDVEAPKKAK